MLSRLVSGGLLGALAGAAMLVVASGQTSAFLRSNCLRSSRPSRPPASSNSNIIIGATTAARTITITTGRIIIVITTAITIGRIITITTIGLIFTSQQRH